MAEGGEGEQDDVSFLRTVSFPITAMSQYEPDISINVGDCRKTWSVFRALELARGSAFQRKVLEIVTASWRGFLTG